MGTRATETETAAAPIRRYLDMVAGVAPGGFPALVRSEGREFPPAATLPAGVARGRLGECFKNAALAAFGDHERFAYAEGWATSARCGGIPFHHAWVVDRATGEAVEVTWKDPGTAYFGVALDWMWFARFLTRSKTYGVFDPAKPAARELLGSADRSWVEGGGAR